MANEEELTKKINELMKEIENIQEWQSSVNQLCRQMLDAIEHLRVDIKEKSEEIDYLSKFGLLNRYRIDSLPYELQDPDYRSFFFKPNILSKAETRKKVIEEHKSFARFGDGEFAAIAGKSRWNFQDKNDYLSIRLREVLDSSEDNMLIGINPTFYMNLFDINEIDADGVRAYMTPEVRRFHAEILDRRKQYGDALFHSMVTDEDVRALKRLWNGRDCVLIEGVHTCGGVGNDLYDECKSLERILCPAENAIEKYDMIMKEALKQSKDKLIMISLGPTATVLAYDLCLEGYHAVDIGHIDLNYEKFLRNSRDVFIPYKYCTKDEVIRRDYIEQIDDLVYKEQIISVIGE